MNEANAYENALRNSQSQRPFIASYDLGYEYSQQHYIALQCMVEDADEVPFASYVSQLEEVAS
jgi:hypothetical protein